jgi:hypothetical protein
MNTIGFKTFSQSPLWRAFGAIVVAISSPEPGIGPVIKAIRYGPRLLAKNFSGWATLSSLLT